MAANCKATPLVIREGQVLGKADRVWIRHFQGDPAAEMKADVS